VPGLCRWTYPGAGPPSPAAAESDAAGIDYLIGVQGLTGQGLGPQLIWNYLRQVVFPARPAVRRVIASPEVANVRSIRALEKAGFRVVREITGEHPGRPEMLCVLDGQHIFG
jgi:RimJ/RimL family protein N-acetyltransferase